MNRDQREFLDFVKRQVENMTLQQLLELQTYVDELVEREDAIRESEDL